MSPLWLGPDFTDAGDRRYHIHITSELAAAFIALRYISETFRLFVEEEPFMHSNPEPEDIASSVWLLMHWSGFGHPECLICHERYENARALGYYEAHQIMDRSRAQHNIKGIDVHKRPK